MNHPHQTRPERVEIAVLLCFNDHLFLFPFPPQQSQPNLWRIYFDISARTHEIIKS